MSAPRHGDQIHVAARFMRLPAVPTTEAFVRIATAEGAVDVKVSQSTVLTTDGTPIIWEPCTSMFLVKGEDVYVRCALEEHDVPNEHRSYFSPSEVVWTDAHPNAVRIQP